MASLMDSSLVANEKKCIRDMSNVRLSAADVSPNTTCATKAESVSLVIFKAQGSEAAQ